MDNFTARCQCSCSMLEMEGDEDGQVCISVWLHGYDHHKLTWIQRMQWCWIILTKGRPWADFMIISKEDASKMKEWLNANTQSGQIPS